MGISNQGVLLAPWRAIRRAWLRLSGGYWLVPLICVAVAVALAFALIATDRYLQDQEGFDWTYAGGPQNASDTLTTIASSMITFTGLVFSITVLALQLTSSQFSPRALRNFLSDRISQFSLGIFIATFAYSFAALSAVRVASDDSPSFVPSITITGAFVLIGISLIMFVEYIHHTAQSLRVVSIIERIADEARKAIDDVYRVDAADGQPAPSPVFNGDRVVHLIRAESGGVITDIDLDGLAECAADQQGIVELLHPVGAYVCEGQTLMHVWWPDDADMDERSLRRFVLSENERTMHHDAAFGIRQLVDIAERALSPGINDPTTAVQCLDRIHDLLRRLSSRDVPTVQTGSHDGVTCAFAPSPSFEDLVALGTEEIWKWGHDSRQVQMRLRSLLIDLLGATRAQPTRHARLRARTEALLATPLPEAWPASNHVTSNDATSNDATSHAAPT
jgi:uncharacterized membrane protein